MNGEAGAGLTALSPSPFFPFIAKGAGPTDPEAGPTAGAGRKRRWGSVMGGAGRRSLSITTDSLKVRRPAGPKKGRLWSRAGGAKGGGGGNGRGGSPNFEPEFSVFTPKSPENPRFSTQNPTSPFIAPQMTQNPPFSTQNPTSPFPAPQLTPNLPFSPQISEPGARFVSRHH